MEIESICGVKPEGIEYFDPGNNPNFVFENDPNYETVVLYNSEGTVINVNSWIECANYVEGGWTNSLISNSNSELYYFLFLIGFTFSLFIYKLIQKKYA